LTAKHTFLSWKLGAGSAELQLGISPPYPFAELELGVPRKNMHGAPVPRIETTEAPLIFA